MGDWNTLHFFDDKRFQTKVVADLLDKGDLLKQYFESKLGKYLLWDNNNSDQKISSILDFCQFLDKDFKRHKILYDISKRKKKPEEEYLTFINRQNQDEKEFLEQNGQTIDDLSTILPLLLFSECASFNPHLILGRRIFTGCVDAKPRSVSSEIISQITDSEYGCIYSRTGSGVINWITNDELQLLWLDKDNLFSQDPDSENYFQEFLQFIEIAIKNNLGVVSVTNVRESILKIAENPYLDIDFNIKERGFKSIIIYE